MQSHNSKGRGLWHFLGSPEILAATSKLGFGWHCLDMQHGLWREPEVTAVFAAGPRDNVAIRLRSATYSDIGFALDAGASHIIVPMVNTPEEASRVSFAARYPPLGGRSWGPLTALTGASNFSPSEANDRIHLSVMIETAEGLQNLDAILDTPGINSVFVGPFDLALSLGTDVDAMLRAPESPLKTIEKACHRRHIDVAAYAGSSVRADAFTALGYDWTATDSDTSLLAAGAALALDGSTTTSKSGY